jgi:hypothetical protein
MASFKDAILNITQNAIAAVVEQDDDEVHPFLHSRPQLAHVYLGQLRQFLAGTGLDYAMARPDQGPFCCPQQLGGHLHRGRISRTARRSIEVENRHLNKTNRLSFRPIYASFIN